MPVERTEFSAKPTTQEAVLATRTNFFETSFALIQTSTQHMGGFYRTNTFRLETKPENKPLEIDRAVSLPTMQDQLTRQKTYAEKVQYLYVSLAGAAGLGAVFALLASNLKDAPQMSLALGLTATAGLFYRKLDKALDIATTTNDKLNFLRRVKV